MNYETSQRLIEKGFPVSKCVTALRYSGNRYDTVVGQYSKYNKPTIKGLLEELNVDIDLLEDVLTEIYLRK